MWSHETVCLCVFVCTLLTVHWKDLEIWPTQGASPVPKFWPWNVIFHEKKQQFSFYTQFIDYFNHKWIYAFPVSIYKTICMIFILCFVNMVDYIYQFAHVELSSAPEWTPLIVMYGSLMCCYIPLASVLFRVFAFLLVCSFIFVLSPPDFWYQGFCWPHKMC